MKYKSLRVWNQERINLFLTRHRVPINSDDDNLFIYLGSPILGRVRATGLLIRSSTHPTSCGIFVCGPLHCLNVNLLLILGAVGLLNFIDPICCSFLHGFAHESKDGFDGCTATAVYGCRVDILQSILFSAWR